MVMTRMIGKAYISIKLDVPLPAYNHIEYDVTRKIPIYNMLIVCYSRYTTRS